MELLGSSPSGAPRSRATLRDVFGLSAAAAAAMAEEERGSGPRGVVHVAVGRSPEKTLRLLEGVFKKFGCREVVLLHVHQPSPTIPTLLGRLPASEASEELLLAYRREEKDCMKKLLMKYINICCRAQVEANVITTESGNVQKAIIDLVTEHGVQKLVVGATLDRCFKVKGRPSMASYIAKNAPPYCEICLICKGKHIWTREAVDDTISGKYITEERFSKWQDSPNMVETESNDRNVHLSPSSSGMVASGFRNSSTSTMTGTPSSHASPIEQAYSMSNSKDDWRLKHYYIQLKELRKDAENSKQRAFEELSRRKKLESAASEAFDKLKASEAAYAAESKLREKLEDKLRATQSQVVELSNNRDDVLKELQIAAETIAALNDQLRDLVHRKGEASNEFETSKEEENTRSENRINNNHARYCDESISFSNNGSPLVEFSLSEIQTATCDFSESFKLGQGGYGCVYKGEMLGKTVAIKKLHAQNVHCRSEFQQEVNVLNKLRHPHLLALFGACPEGLCLVYEYQQNGSLHERLFRKGSVPSLSWKVRTRIAAEISSALLFLHSSKPEKIVHGDLKTENIFLDADFICKIGDLGICQLVPEDAMDFPLLKGGSELNYSDPDFQRRAALTTKADVYSFGIIVMQLLTGRRPMRLAGEVRKAVSSGKLSAILDSSAGEWPISVADKLTELALQCTETNSRDRLELTPAVVMELEELHATKQRVVPSYYLCPILQEIMYDPQVAADGFSYEGNALREWLENGRETSPMTNLRLMNPSLTPNHALRFAIQGWLCQS